MTATERLIAQIYANVYKQVFTTNRTRYLLQGNRDPMLSALDALDMSAKYDEFAKKFAIELAKKGLYGQKGTWRKYFNAAKKARYIALDKTWTQFEADVMTKAIEHNFAMIKSIPVRMKEILHHKYTSQLIEEVAKGSLPRGSFQRMLASHGNKQAKVIARTEAAKLQTAILENRATQLGSVAYIWLASNDKRTRPSHRAMNNVVVFWRSQNEKPILDNMQGNAGEFPNCRCSPQPIVDVDDLLDSYYKVYDYHARQVIRLTKKQLITALTAGQL